MGLAFQSPSSGSPYTASPADTARSLPLPPHGHRFFLTAQCTGTVFILRGSAVKKLSFVVFSPLLDEEFLWTRRTDIIRPITHNCSETLLRSKMVFKSPYFCFLWTLRLLFHCNLNPIYYQDSESNFNYKEQWLRCPILLLFFFSSNNT